MQVAALAGLVDGRIVERFDAYAGTESAAKVADHMGLTGLNFFARK
jgi:hypothetical protein